MKIFTTLYDKTLQWSKHPHAPRYLGALSFAESSFFPIPPDVMLMPMRYLLGGWGWVLWGVSLRIAVSLTGHWAVGHYGHRRGQQDWRIDGLPVQGYNLAGLSFLSFGENWHGNHHAFPHSARLGLRPGQRDLGFALIRALRWLGLAWHIRLPHSAPPRAGLVRIA